MQARLRRFLGEYNRRHGATMILTSHYMADVQALCPRVILIHHGQLLYDGELGGLARHLAPFKLVRLALRPEETRPPGWSRRCRAIPAGRGPGRWGSWPGVDLLSQEDGTLTLRVPRSETAALTAHLLQSLPVIDLSSRTPRWRRSSTRSTRRAACELARGLGPDPEHLELVDAVPELLLPAGLRLDDPAADLPVRLVDRRRRRDDGGMTRGSSWPITWS
jgi:hypothetical protein